MITWFPEVYPDELLYSVMARYHAGSGNLAYWYTTKQLFKNKKERPEMFFVNEYSDEVYTLLTRSEPFERVIMNHTMFPYYGRFLPKERRNIACESLLKMRGNFCELLAFPKSKDGKSLFLRYCPLCAEADRSKYGETYWHRIHQMIGTKVCPIHHCFLIDSPVIKSDRTSPSLVNAEEVIPTTLQTVHSDNDIACKFAEYMMKVLLLPMDLENDVPIGDFFHSKLSGTKYLSPRGQQRNISLLHENFKEYYKELPDNHFTELWQLQKMFTNDKSNFNEVCMVAMFLDVPISDLANMALPQKSQQQIFDEKVFELHEQGLRYPEIAKRLNASLNVVKPVGEKRYCYCDKPKVPKKRVAMDWKQIDYDTLPLVKDAIKKLWGDADNRPQPINSYRIEKMLGFHFNRIKKYMPMCYQEILEYEESQEQYFARRIVWGYERILEMKKHDGDKVFWTDIRNYVGVKKENFIASREHFKEYTDENTAKEIRKLIKINYSNVL